MNVCIGVFLVLVTKIQNIQSQAECPGGYREISLTGLHKDILSAQVNDLDSYALYQVLDTRQRYYQDEGRLDVRFALTENAFDNAFDRSSIIAFGITVKNAQSIKISRQNRHNNETHWNDHDMLFNPNDGDEDWKIQYKLENTVSGVYYEFKKRVEEERYTIISLELIACLKRLCTSTISTCSDKCHETVLTSKLLPQFVAAEGAESPNQITVHDILHVLDGRIPLTMKTQNTVHTDVMLSNHGAGGEFLTSVRFAVKNVKNVLIKSKQSLQTLQFSGSENSWNTSAYFLPGEYGFSLSVQKDDENKAMEIESYQVKACVRNDVCPVDYYFNMLTSDVKDQFRICMNNNGRCDAHMGSQILQLMDDYKGTIQAPPFILNNTELDMRIGIIWRKIDGILTSFHMVVSGAAFVRLSLDFVITYADILMLKRPYHLGPEDDWVIDQEFYPPIRDHTVYISADGAHAITIKELSSSSCLKAFPCCSAPSKVRLDYRDGFRFFNLTSTEVDRDPWLATKLAPVDDWATSEDVASFYINATSAIDMKHLCLHTKGASSVVPVIYMNKELIPHFTDSILIPKKRQRSWKKTCIVLYTDVTAVEIVLGRSKQHEAMYVKDMQLVGCRS